MINQYHQQNELEPSLNFKYDETIEQIIAAKNLIDTIQWHLEDEIRSPDLPGHDVLQLKRKIDSSNQKRTDCVEEIDQLIHNQFKDVIIKEGATFNSETPAWIIDRLSILCLKIFHMNEQTDRTDVSEEHIKDCQHKLNVLLAQQADLAIAFDQLIFDLSTGYKYIKLYLQMKMYNDANLNPVLYKNKDA